ncbi:hypothetical protein Brsp02_02637 [Brucella sp. NBRC 113783]
MALAMLKEYKLPLPITSRIDSGFITVRVFRTG